MCRGRTHLHFKIFIVYSTHQYKVNFNNKWWWWRIWLLRKKKKNESNNENALFNSFLFFFYYYQLVLLLLFSFFLLPNHHTTTLPWWMLPCYCFCWSIFYLRIFLLLDYNKINKNVVVVVRDILIKQCNGWSLRTY